jgi:Sulfatase
LNVTGNNKKQRNNNDFLGMDGYIGNIFALLKKLGIDDETIVLFASDNGAHNEGGHDYRFFDRFLCVYFISFHFIHLF